MMSRVRRVAQPRTALLAALSVVAVLVTAAPASAGPDRAPVFPPDAPPYGQSYSEWAADWWTWALTQPKDVNPLLDTTGANCAQGQSGRVWFLAGTFGAGEATRSCTVPKHTALLFPVLNSFSGATTTDPPEQHTEEYQRRQVTPAMRAATALSASIDGVEVPKIRRYFEESIVFRVVLPPNNIFGLNHLCTPEPPVDAGCVVFPTVDAGYYLMVRPLSNGRHKIRFAGSAAFGTVAVKYTITVAGPGNVPDD